VAISIVWDQIEGAELEQSVANGRRLVLSGYVTGITTAVTTAKMAMIDAITAADGRAALGAAYDPTLTTYRCMYRVFRAIPGTSGTKGRIFAHFETPQGGTPFETFAAEDLVSLVAEPTGVFPGTAKQLRCSLTSTSPNYTTDTPATTDRPIIANYPRTMRSLVLYGLFASRPSVTVKNAANKVNSATWQGLGAGYWRCEGPRVRYSNSDGMYAVSVGFLNKGEGTGEDWSTYEIPRKADGTLGTVKDSILTTLYAQAYQYGIRSDKDGVWKAGLYKTANFSAIFGDNFNLS
jgi:hypothetical protein